MVIPGWHTPPNSRKGSKDSCSFSSSLSLSLVHAPYSPFGPFGLTLRRLKVHLVPSRAISILFFLHLFFIVILHRVLFHASRDRLSFLSDGGVFAAGFLVVVLLARMRMEQPPTHTLVQEQRPDERRRLSFVFRTNQANEERKET